MPRPAPINIVPGRKSLLETGKKQVLLTAISKGNRLPVAARLAGLSPRTVEEWLHRGRGQHARAMTHLHEAFVKEFEQAQAQAEALALENVQKAAFRDWRAAAWFLENTSPDWRRRKALPEPEPPPLPVIEPEPKTLIVLTSEDMQGIARRRLHAENGEDNVTEEQWAARRRLVSDISHPNKRDSDN